MLGPGSQWKKTIHREMKLQKCWFSTTREVRRELEAFTTSEKTKGYFNKPLGRMMGTQWKPHPNQHICDWWLCPAQSTHGRQQHPDRHLQTPSHAQEHIWALKTTLASACHGQEMFSSSSSSQGPGNPNWGPATGTLMHMDCLSNGTNRLFLCS